MMPLEPANDARDCLARLCGPRARDLRLAVVVAHPDDEVIGAGSRLPWLENLLLVHVTDGSPADPRDAEREGLTASAYAQARRRELAAALAAAGRSDARTIEIGVQDQQASLHLAEIARRLAEVFAAERPEAVLTHPYEGGHPDHDATAFAVWAACALLVRQGRPAPAVLEMASYHDDNGSIATGRFLPSEDQPLTLDLSGDGRALKRRLIECFPSQRETLSLFAVERESFRVAPAYDFSRPPHPGTLYYERYPWGMTGERFRALTAAATAELGLETAWA